jgi:hypothetical protein
VASRIFRIISVDGIRVPRRMREMVERSTSRRAASASSVTLPAFIHSLSRMGIMCHEGTSTINLLCASRAKDSYGA